MPFLCELSITKLGQHNVAMPCIMLSVLYMRSYGPKVWCSKRVKTFMKYLVSIHSTSRTENMEQKYCFTYDSFLVFGWICCSYVL
jgi:hypothetical protein